MSKEKVIKVDKPVPKWIKAAIEKKQDWIKKVQSGEIVIDKSNARRIA